MCPSGATDCPASCVHLKIPTITAGSSGRDGSAAKRSCHAVDHAMRAYAALRRAAPATTVSECLLSLLLIFCFSAFYDHVQQGEVQRAGRVCSSCDGKTSDAAADAGAGEAHDIIQRCIRSARHLSCFAVASFKAEHTPLLLQPLPFPLLPIHLTVHRWERDAPAAHRQQRRHRLRLLLVGAEQPVAGRDHPPAAEPGACRGAAAVLQRDCCTPCPLAHPNPALTPPLRLRPAGSRTRPCESGCSRRRRLRRRMPA